MVIKDVLQTAPRTPADGRGNIHRVLVAFDGSEGAWAALELGVEVAVSNRALLTIAAVVEEPRFVWQGPGAVAVPYTRESMRRDIEREMRRHLAAARDEVPATVSVTTQLLRGRPARALAKLAEEGRYDLVITGPRPSSRLARLLRGGVTHGLLQRAHTSVLAVRPH
jgi:nucleotide-binding universal stress UspA family protein